MPSAAASFTSSRQPPRIVGMPRMKEYFTAVSLVKPLNRPLAMVEPEREMPGIRAMPWKIPTVSAFLTVMSFGSLVPLPQRSDKKRMTAVYKKQKPMTIRCLLETSSTRSFKGYRGNSTSREISSMIIMRRSPFMVLHLNFPVKISLSMHPSSLMSAQMVSRKAMNTATSVPRCRMAEKNRPFSSVLPKICWYSARCPELETGRNSVSP